MTDAPPSTSADWYADADEAARTASSRRAVEGFEATFGRPPAGVWAAPGRVNVIGEHVDYNGGLCLPFALAHRTYVALAPRDDDRLVITSAQGQDEAGEGPAPRGGPPSGRPPRPGGRGGGLRGGGAG